MKIRLKGNSIRIRLTRPEVERFGQEGYLEEKTEFGIAAFTYALQSRDGGHTLSAMFDGQKITLYVPSGMATEWVHTNKIGFDSYMNIGEGKQLFLLLEKDFKCIDSDVQEDQSDSYENPLTICE